MDTVSGRPLKVLWAVDAFDDFAEGMKTQVQVLQDLAARHPIEVNPVHVLSPGELGVSVEFAGPWSDVYTPAARKTLAQKLKDVSIPGMKEPEILIQNRVSLSRSVDVFARFASSLSYDLIVVGSHGRKGLRRLMLGSFAEQLLLQSKVPVLVVGAHAHRWEDGPVRVLLPSDFENPHSPLFPQVFAFADFLTAKIILHSAVPKPVDAVFQSGVYMYPAGWVPAPVYLEEEAQRQTQAATRVMERAKKRQLDCDLIIDDRAASVVDSILTQAKETRAGLIAMAAQSGAVATTLIGSVTRQVVREAPCPVLVFRLETKP